jgi:uncharacterized protein YicC (UPF0701 family)
MSDLLKKFKSVFIVEDETATTAEPTEQAPANAGNQQPQSTPIAAPPTAKTTGAVSSKFVDILAGALEKNNQEGFDYFEFRQSLINLAKMPMDEATRYQSAFAMAQTMGVTSAKLVDSAQFYLTVLSNEQTKFNEAHAQQRAKLIGNREEEAKNLDALIQQKAEQIKKLTQEIGEHQKQSEQIRKDISDATIKIENTKADFEATFASVVAQLQADVAKMQQHLK